MSKSKAKSRSEREYLRGIIRKLKSDLKACQSGHEPEDEIEEDEQAIICDECGKGELVFLDLGRACYSRCTVCEIRKKL